MLVDVGRDDDVGDAGFVFHGDEDEACDSDHSRSEQHSDIQES